RLAELGRIDAPEDVFHLSNRDLEAFVLGRWGGQGARELSTDRRAQWRAWLTESPADVITWQVNGESHSPAPVPEITREPGMDFASGGRFTRWRGVAASSGRVTGIARVLRGPGGGARLKRGEGLVAPSTDPGWTPLFLRAGAIVMETGGYISHGAIVAREYGLPAVVNMPGILQHISDGDRLVVDGDLGEVLRLASVEQPEP